MQLNAQINFSKFRWRYQIWINEGSKPNECSFFEQKSEKKEKSEKWRDSVESGRNIRDRSGLAFKHGLHTLAGVIDSNYRGEIKVVIINLKDM